MGSEMCIRDRFDSLCSEVYFTVSYMFINGQLWSVGRIKENGEKFQTQFSIRILQNIKMNFIPRESYCSKLSFDALFVKIDNPCVC